MRWLRNVNSYPVGLFITCCIVLFLAPSLLCEEATLALRGSMILGVAGLDDTKIVRHVDDRLLKLGEGLRSKLIASYHSDEIVRQEKKKAELVREVRVKKVQVKKIQVKKIQAEQRKVEIMGLMGPSTHEGNFNQDDQSSHADSMRLIAGLNEGNEEQVITKYDALMPENPLPYSELIDRIAKEYGVSPALAAAVIKVESGFKPKAISDRGARGLMQLLPSTAHKVGLRENIYDPEHNIRGGVKYLKMMLDRYNGDEQLALAAYNAGPAAVDKHQDIPPYRETEDYVPRVLKYFKEYVKYFRDI